MEGFLSEYLKYFPDNRPQLYSDSEYYSDYYLGRGTFGEVFKGHERTGRSVAIKRIYIDQHEMKTSALRESVVLKKLKHHNIVKLFQVLTSGPMDRKPCVFLVFEYCKFDLLTYFKYFGEISQNGNKNIMRQLVNAVSFMHANRFLHRDIKPDNILMDHNGVVKLADFGMARSFRKENERCSTNVVTLWYRAPEILLEDPFYGPAIDIWSVGCVFAELWTRQAMFRGYCELDQIQRIIDYCGPLSTLTWPEVEELKGYRTVYACGPTRRLKEMMKMAISDREALDLLDRLLVLDPQKRISAEEALEHSFLKTNRDVKGQEKSRTRHDQNETQAHPEDLLFPLILDLKIQ